MSYRTRRDWTRKAAAFAALATSASVLVFSTPSGATQAVTQTRISGADRYATAAAVSAAAFPGGSNNIVLVSGENFPDGLASAGLAGAANAPILLTQKDSLPISTVDEIATLDALVAGPATIHIVGGLSAVGQSVRDQLTALGYTLNALSGADRYATSAAVANFAKANLGPLGLFGGKRTAIIASGEGFADALSAGAPAFSGKHSILLTKKDSLPASISASLTNISAQQVIIVGGTSAVSAAVETAITALGISVIRISGADRYATATALAGVLITAAPAGFGYYTPGGPDLDGVVLASGENFPDALTAGAMAGKLNDPLVLSQQCAIPAPTATFLTANNAEIEKIRTIGGTSAICDAAKTAAGAAATQVTPTAVITALQGHSNFTVVFSEKMTVGTVNTGDFSVVRAGTDPVATLVTPLDSADAGVTAKTFLITTDLPLAPVDAVNLGAGLAATPAPVRLNAVASAIVAPDTVRPTVTINAPAGSNTMFVTYSEAMNAASVNTALTDITVVDVIPPTIDIINVLTIAYNPLTLTATVGLDSNLEAGDLVTVVDSLSADLTGNLVVGKTITVLQDITPPTITKAVLGSVSEASPATGTISTAGGDVGLTGNATGATQGIKGNGWTVTLTDGADAAPMVVVVTAGTKTIAVTADFTGGNAITATAFAIAWAGSGAGPLFTPTVLDAAPMTVAGATVTSGGLTLVLVATLFSEAIKNIASGDLKICDSTSVFANCAFMGLLPPASDPDFDGLNGWAVILDGVAPDVPGPGAVGFPIAGTTVIRTSAAGVYTDLSNNLNLNQEIVLSAS